MLRICIGVAFIVASLDFVPPTTAEALGWDGGALAITALGLCALGLWLIYRGIHPNRLDPLP
jgi:hypothetical protein